MWELVFGKIVCSPKFRLGFAPQICVVHVSLVCTRQYVYWQEISNEAAPSCTAHRAKARSKSGYCSVQKKKKEKNTAPQKWRSVVCKDYVNKRSRLVRRGLTVQHEMLALQKCGCVSTFTLSETPWQDGVVRRSKVDYVTKFGEHSTVQ